MTRRLPKFLTLAWVLLMAAILFLCATSFSSQNILLPVLQHPGLQFCSYRGRLIISATQSVNGWPGPMQVGIGIYGVTSPGPKTISVSNRYVSLMVLEMPRAAFANGFGFGRSWGLISASKAVAPGRSVNIGGMNIHVFAVSDWAILLSCVTTAALTKIPGWRVRLRASRGLCPRCGYDLRATPQRCPECGAENRYNGIALTEM
jgi:hypothetical protein